MKIDLITMQPMSVVMIEHRGSYDKLTLVFDQLWEWVERYEVPVTRTLGVFLDNPDHKIAWLLRSAACVEVPADYEIPAKDGLKLIKTEVGGGRYAMTRYVGPYDEMKPVWQEFTRRIEQELGYTITDAAAIEVYVNDASDTPPDQLITDLYMPVQ